MNIQPLKIFVVILSLFFLSSCAVFVRDEDWDHHYHHNHEYWHHSSLQQSETRMAAQDSGDSGGQGQVGRWCILDEAGCLRLNYFQTQAPWKKPGFFVSKYCFLIDKIQGLPDLPPCQSLIRLKKSPPCCQDFLATKRGKEQKEVVMAMMTVYHPILSLIAGILILIFPRLLNYIVAIYLIIAGLVGFIH